MQGRFNVSYNDLNTLAYPVLRHRIKLNFEAITERVSADDVITMIIDELNGKKPAKTATAASSVTEEKTENSSEEEGANKKTRKLFGRK